MNGDCNNLPMGWVDAQLGQVCQFEYGKSLPKAKRKGGRYPVYGSNGIVGYHDNYIVKGRSVIVGRKGSSGKINISNENCWPIDTTYYIPESSVSINFNFLALLLTNLHLENLDRSTAIPGLNREEAYQINISIPPLSEQGRIVKRFENLSIQIRHVKEELAKISPILKKFCQSVLAKAFSGELTKEWREKQTDLEPASKLLERIREERKKKLGKKYKEPMSIDTSDLPELPEGWCWSRLGECCLVNARHSKGILSSETPVSFVPMPAIDAEFGAIAKSLTKPLKDVIKGYTHFIEGDVLFAKITPCMENGKAAIAKNLTNGIGCGTTELHVLRPLGGISSGHIFHYIRQQSFRDKAESQMTGTAGQLRVPAEFMKNVAIPLPAIAEQQVIVAKIDKFMNKVWAIKRFVDTTLHHCESLSQSILAKAFRGELVPQDPNDEPAENLLLKIKTTKNTMLGMSKATKRKRKLH